MRSMHMHIAACACTLHATPVTLNVFENLLEQFSPSLQYFRVRFSVATSASATRDGRQADLHTKMLLAVNNDAHKKKQAHPPPGPPRMPPAAAAFASAQICVFSLGLFDVARGWACSGHMHLLTSRECNLSAQGSGQGGPSGTVRQHGPISGAMRDHSASWAMVDGAGAKRGDMMRLKQKSPGDLLSAHANARGCVGHLKARRTTFLELHRE